MEMTEHLKLIDNFVESWNSIVVPIYGKKSNDNRYYGIGSGFLVNFKKEIFLVTCLHVVECAKNYKGVFGIFNGNGITFHEKNFYIDKDNDIATTHLDAKFANENKLEKVKAFPFEKDKSEYKESGLYFFMGYPSSKNVLSTVGGFDRRLQSYSIDVHKRTNAETKINKNIAFYFDAKSMLTTNLEKKIPPTLNGVSGGPLLSISILENDYGIDFSLILVGVFSEWYQNKKKIVFTEVSAVTDLLNDVCGTLE